MGINILNDTDEDVLEFIRNRVEAYGIYEHQGDDLWWDFYDDFKEFTKAECFLRAGTEYPRRLKDILRKRGVYIPKDKKPSAGNLVALLNLDEPPVWPTTDKEYGRVIELMKPDHHRTQSTISSEKIKANYLEDHEVRKEIYPLSQIQPRKKMALPEQNPTILKVDPSIEYDEFRISIYKPHGFSQHLATLTKIYNESSNVTNIRHRLIAFHHSTHSRNIQEVQYLADDIQNILVASELLNGSVLYKYSGNGDTFDYKFDIFLRQCANADIPKNGLPNLFPILLKDDALDFYYSFYCDGQEHNLKNMCKNFKEKFEGVEHKRTLLANWNKLTFESIINHKDNIGKTTIQSLQTLTRRLTIMQHGLDINLRNNAFIHNKLVTAYETQPVFKN
ncbi:hypothetical protein EPUL_005793, partial [Erysiphe pulchra]